MPKPVADKRTLLRRLLDPVGDILPYDKANPISREVYGSAETPPACNQSSHFNYGGEQEPREFQIF